MTPLLRPCRLCHTNDQMHLLYEFGPQPVAGYLEADEATAATAPRFDLALALCSACGYVQQANDNGRDILVNRVYAAYQATYSMSASVSTYMQTFLARAIRESGAAAGDVVVEIGSNDGRLLELLVKQGYRAIGFEPSSNLNVLARERGGEVIEDFLSMTSAKAYAEKYPPAKLVLTRHTLEHAFEPLDFLQGIAAILAPGGMAVIEVPYIRPQMVDNHVEAMTFQHVSFFSISSMRHALEKSGLMLHDLAFVQMDGGSMVVYAKKAAHGSSERAVDAVLASEAALGLDRPTAYGPFFERVTAMRRTVGTFLTDAASRGLLSVGYGGGTKGQSIINILGLDRGHLQFVIDDVPENAGKFIPGTHIQIVPSSDRRVARTDVVLLTAPTHIREILDKEAARQAAGTLFISTVPDWHFVGRGQP